MNLKRLKHLVALADTRHFGQAAQQCNLSQPAFSRSIQAAEEQLGLKLFERNSNEISCTSAGTFVIERARKLLFDSRCLERDINLYRERLIGDLSIGTGPYPAATIVPKLISTIRAQFANVNIRVDVNNANNLEQLLRTEKIDFYIADLRNVPTTSDLELTRIAQLSAGFYVQPSHPLLKKSLVTTTDLIPHGLASVYIPESLQKMLAPLMGLTVNSPIPLAVECDDINTLKAVTMSSDTVLVCADDATEHEIATQRLARLEVTGFPALFSDMGVVSLKGRSFSPLAQFSIDFLKQLDSPAQ